MEGGSGRGGGTFAAARRHSRVVGTLKVAIPAFAILSVVLVLGLSFFNPFGRLPGLSLGPISFSGSKIAMESPRLTGFRKDNRPYEVTATVAYQDLRSPNVLELKAMKARMVSDNTGGLVNLTSDEGIYDSGKDHLDLSSNVRLWTEKGEQMFLSTASVDIKAGKVVSREPVQVRTPTMTVDADGLDVADGGKVLAFIGRVHVNMQPSSGAKPAPAVAAATGPSPSPAPVVAALPVVPAAEPVIAAVRSDGPRAPIRIVDAAPTPGPGSVTGSTLPLSIDPRGPISPGSISSGPAETSRIAAPKPAAIPLPPRRPDGRDPASRYTQAEPASRP